MSKKQRAELLIRDNPKAGRHATSIRQTLADLRRLKKVGIGDGGYNLAPPFQGGTSVGKAPRPSDRSSIKNRLKMTFNA